MAEPMVRVVAARCQYEECGWSIEYPPGAKPSAGQRRSRAREWAAVGGNIDERVVPRQVAREIGFRCKYGHPGALVVLEPVDSRNA